jgi:hypothetical protein
VEKRRGWGWVVIWGGHGGGSRLAPTQSCMGKRDGAEAAGRSRGSSAVPCRRREKRRACTGRARKKTVLYERERKGKRKK